MSEQEKELETTGTQKAAKPEKSEKAAKPAKKKEGIFQRISRWFREMRSELKKVQWPTWKQTLNNTVTVIICVILVGVFVWVFDWLVRLVVDALLMLVGKA